LCTWLVPFFLVILLEFFPCPITSFALDIPQAPTNLSCTHGIPSVLFSLLLCIQYVLSFGNSKLLENSSQHMLMNNYFSLTFQMDLPLNFFLIVAVSCPFFTMRIPHLFFLTCLSKS
jgi:hypothetical protein